MILIISAMVPIITAEINSTGTYFWLSPTTPIVQASGTFSVNIMIAGAPPTWSWQATLNFNKTVLGVLKTITEGSWLSSSGAKRTQGIVANANANSTGSLTFGDTLVNGTSPHILYASNQTSGSGTLCTITFTIKAAGNSPLDLINTELVELVTNPSWTSGSSELLTVTTAYPNNDGYWSSSSVLNDIAVTGIKTNATLPAQVPQGKIVQISVNVTNEGSNAETFNVAVTASPNDTRLPVVSVGVQSSSVIAGSGNLATLTFLWNTASVAGGFYTIIANATITPPSVIDQDLHDNVYIGPAVWVVCPHDISVVSVTSANTTAPTDPKIPYYVKITVTVKNIGSNTENLKVWVYANQTTPLATPAFTSYSVTSLASGATNTTVVQWNTMGYKSGSYLLAANASITSATEPAKNLLDNRFVDTTPVLLIYQHVVITGNMKVFTVSPYYDNQINSTYMAMYRGDPVAFNLTATNNSTTLVFGTIYLTMFAPYGHTGALLYGLELDTSLGVNVTSTYNSILPWCLPVNEGGQNMTGFLTAPLPPKTMLGWIPVYASFDLSKVPYELNTTVSTCCLGYLHVNWQIGDVTLMKVTNAGDVILILINFGKNSDTTYPFVDVDFNGVVNSADVILALLNFGKYPNPPYS
jgi:hypothetical protein